MDEKERCQLLIELNAIGYWDRQFMRANAINFGDIVAYWNRQERAREIADRLSAHPELQNS